jgi:hypothetical protein
MSRRIVAATALVLIGIGLGVGYLVFGEKGSGDKWASLFEKYCTGQFDSKLKEMGYGPNEKPAFWVLSASEGRSDFTGSCKRRLFALTAPCRAEYKYGTDSAIQCIDRYTKEYTDELQDLLIRLMPLKSAQGRPTESSGSP